MKQNRRNWRKKYLKIVYFGTSQEDMENANIKFWKNAGNRAKFKAMQEFVADELDRQGLTEYGPKLLRLTATIRKA